MLPATASAAGETITAAKITGNGYYSDSDSGYWPDLTQVIGTYQGGNIEFYQCSCGKYFKDANATTEYKNGDKDVILPRTDHVDENKDGKCDFCKCDLATEPTEATQPDDTETDSKQDKKPSSKKDRNDEDDEDEESIFEEIPWWIFVIAAALVVGIVILVILIVRKKRGA